MKTQYITILSGLFIPSLAGAQTPDVKPNIILINIDDLGWADVGYNGAKYYETPNIDKLHSKGVSFNTAYAAAANSAPSRASLLTGLYGPRHGVYTVNPADRGNPKDRKLMSAANNRHVHDSIETLPTALRSEGYATCHVGKWHIGNDPLKQGMDVNIGGTHLGHPKSHFAPYRNPKLRDGANGECLTTRLGIEAVNYIDTVASEKPFFLYYAPFAVHTPLQANDSLIRKYQLKESSEAHNNPKYAAMVEVVDETVGMILKAVDERGILENTVIVFTSDNGGVYDISKQWPLRAGKGSFYEGGIREPFIIYQKGVFDGGKEYDVAVSQLDLFPTFIELAGGSCSLDGVSLLPLLSEGRVGSELSDRALYWHFPAYLEDGNVETRDAIFRSRPVSVVRHKGWKLIENYEDGSLELYDLEADPSEKVDLAELKPRKTKALYKMLNGWKLDTNAAMPSAVK